MLHGYDPQMHIDVEDAAVVREVPAVMHRLEKLAQLRAKAEDHWKRAVESHAKYYNRRHKAEQFKRNDLVALSTKNLRLKAHHKKLTPKYVGPFRVIEKIGAQAYRLALPAQYDKLHNVFPVTLLERWNERTTGEAQMPLPELEDDTEEWEVEAVKGKAVRRGEVYYLVQWVGWPPEYNQWIPEEDMGNAKDAIARFERNQKRKGTRS